MNSINGISGVQVGASTALQGVLHHAIGDPETVILELVAYHVTVSTDEHTVLCAPIPMSFYTSAHTVNDAVEVMTKRGRVWRPWPPSAVDEALAYLGAEYPCDPACGWTVEDTRGDFAVWFVRSHVDCPFADDDDDALAITAGDA